MDDNPNYYREDLAWTTASGRASYCVMTPLRLAVMCTPRNDGNRPYRSDIGYIVRETLGSPWSMEQGPDGKVAAFVANTFHKSDVAEGERVPAHGFMLDSLEQAILRADEPENAAIIVEKGKLQMVASAQYDARQRLASSIAARQILHRRLNQLDAFAAKHGSGRALEGPTVMRLVDQVVVGDNVFLVRVGENPLLTITNIPGMEVGAEGEQSVKNLSVTWNGDALLGLPGKRPRLQAIVTDAFNLAKERFAAELQAAADAHIKAEMADIQMIDEFLNEADLRVNEALAKVKIEAGAFEPETTTTLKP